MDKKLIKFELKGAELDLFDDLQEKKKIEKPKTLRKFAKNIFFNDSFKTRKFPALEQVEEQQKVYHPSKSNTEQLKDWHLSNPVFVPVEVDASTMPPTITELPMPPKIELQKISCTNDTCAHRSKAGFCHANNIQLVKTWLGSESLWQLICKTAITRTSR